MVTKVVWVVWVGKSRCLIFHLLYNRLNKWGVNIWVVKIVGISLSISLSIGLTFPPFGSLHSGSLSLSGSSGSSGEWDGERRKREADAEADPYYLLHHPYYTTPLVKPVVKKVEYKAP